MKTAKRDASAAVIDARLRRRRAALPAIIVLVGLCLSAVWVAISTGSYPIGPGEVLDLLSGRLDEFPTTVILEWRLPRIVAALLLGAGLGLSGALLQGVTRNPLSSPDLLGISGGAFTGVLITLTLTSGGWAAVLPAAVIGGAAAGIAVLLLGWGRGMPTTRFVLIGVVLAALLTAVDGWLIMSASLDSAMSAAAWGAGSLAALDWSGVVVAGAALCLAAIVCLALAPALRVHDLGDETASALGIRPPRLRLTLLALSVLLAATATAVSGPIGFLALAAPAIGRRMLRTGGTSLLGSALVGAALLALADLIAQHLLPGGLPAGVVTTVIGGGYLVWLVLRR